MFKRYNTTPRGALEPKGGVRTKRSNSVLIHVLDRSVGLGTLLGHFCFKVVENAEADADVDFAGDDGSAVGECVGLELEDLVRIWLSSLLSMLVPREGSGMIRQACVGLTWCSRTSVVEHAEALLKLVEGGYGGFEYAALFMCLELGDESAAVVVAPDGFHT